MSEPAQERCRIERLDAAHWGVLRPDWERLHAASESPTFFLSGTWMDAWLAVFGAELEPAFLCLMQEGNVAGIAMVCQRRERQGPFRKRQLYLNTAGEGRDSPMLEHNALLCQTECRETFAAALLGTLAAMPWDEWVLSGIRRSDYEVIVKNCQLKRLETWRPAPHVDLELLRSSGAPYLASLSRNTRQQIKRSINLYQSRGELVIEEADTLDDARAWFNELVDLHQAVWRERDKAGAFASTLQRAFHERIIGTGLARGEVQILRVRTGAETVGVLYNISHSGHISYYQSGFRYEDDNRLKPGLVCHALAVQRAMDLGFREYDFLAAANDGARYKVSLSNANREFGWITFRRDSFKSKAMDAFGQARLKLRWR